MNKAICLLLIAAIAESTVCNDTSAKIAVDSLLGAIQGLFSAAGFTSTSECTNSTHMVVHIINNVKNFSKSSNKALTAFDTAMGIVNLVDVCSGTVAALKQMYSQLMTVFESVGGYEEMIIDVITELVDLYPDIKIAVNYFNHCQYYDFGQKLGNILWCAVLK